MSEPNAYRLQQAMAAFQSLASRLDADLETDSDNLAAALWEAEQDVETLLRHVIRAHLEAKSMAAAAKARIEDIEARKARYEAKAENLRAVAFAVMDALGPDEKGKTRFVDPEFTASFREGQPRVVVTDEKQIPLRFHKQIWTLDKAALNAAVLIDGEVVPGAERANSLPSLMVKTK